MMNRMTEEEYIRERIEDQIQWHDKKSVANKQLYNKLQIAEFIAAALIPVCSAFLEGPWWLRLAVALLGAGLVVMEGAERLFKFHEIWLDYRATTECLKCELYYYKTQSGFYKEIENPFPHLVERVEGILSDEHTAWREQCVAIPSSAHVQGTGLATSR